MSTSFELKSQVPTQKVSHQESQSAKVLPSRTIVHAKLEMTEPGDHDEREADAVANTIVSGGKIARKISSGGSGSSGIAVSQQMESQLSQLQGGGRQMPEGLRSMMENGFGQDFGQVRLHTDNEAASMSGSIHAKAFTHGNDIYFNRGQFSPETSEGQRLVAHELTHVVQGTGKVGREPNANEGDLYNPSKFDDRLFLGKNPFFMNFDFGPNDSRLAFRRFNQDMNNRLIENNRLVISYLYNRELNYLKSIIPKDIVLYYNYNNTYDPDELVLDYVPGKGGVVGSRKDVDRMKIRATGDMIRETGDNIRSGLVAPVLVYFSIQRGGDLEDQLYASQFGAIFDGWLTNQYGIKGVPRNRLPSDASMLNKARRGISNFLYPIERYQIESGDVMEQVITGPVKPLPLPKTTQTNPNNTAPKITNTNDNAKNNISYIITTPKPTIFNYTNLDNTTLKPTNNYADLIINYNSSVYNNSLNNSTNINRAITIFSKLIKGTKHESVLNMYLFNAKANNDLGKTDQAKKSLDLMIKYIHSMEKDK